MASSIDLTISKDYVPDWGIVEGVRELFQNALDQQTTDVANTMGWTYEDNVLTITNKQSILTRDTLLFGTSSKASDNNTIGKFGEGYKLAMLVLTRADKKVTIYNNKLNEKWVPRFKVSKKLNNATVLTVDMTRLTMPWNKGSNDLEITIEGITVDEFEELKETNLHLAFYDNSDDYSNEFGTVLLGEDMVGKIFVSGLYVSTDTDLRFGYDFKPAVINLNRDRNMVNGYDLLTATSKVCNSLPIELLREAIETDAPDTKYIYYKLPSNTEVKDKIVDKIVATHGSNVKAVTTQSEADNLKVLSPTLKTVVVSELMANIINNSAKIDTTIQVEETIKVEDSLYNDLKEYINENLEWLSKSTITELLEILKKEDVRNEQKNNKSQED